MPAVLSPQNIEDALVRGDRSVLEKWLSQGGIGRAPLGLRRHGAPLAPVSQLLMSGHLELADWMLDRPHPDPLPPKLLWANLVRSLRLVGAKVANWNEGDVDDRAVSQEEFDAARRLFRRCVTGLEAPSEENGGFPDWAAEALRITPLKHRVWEVLAENGVGATAVRPDGLAGPLAIAAFVGDADLVVRLVNEGADVGWQDAAGNTVLHYAVASRTLLFPGGRSSMKHYDPEQLARRWPMVRGLLDAGCPRSCNDAGADPWGEDPNRFHWVGRLQEAELSRSIHEPPVSRRARL